MKPTDDTAWAADALITAMILFGAALLFEYRVVRKAIRRWRARP